MKTARLHLESKMMKIVQNSILYPAGVKDRNDMFDSSTIRIEYVVSDGGIIGYTYCKETT